MILDPEKQDLTKLAISRLAGQYSGSENLKAFISTFTSEGDELKDALFQLLTERDLDPTIDPESGQYRIAAKGEVLDVIGRIVGQDRTLLNAAWLSFFAFKEDPDDEDDDATSWGEEDKPWVGGRWLEEGQSNTGNVVLDDILYRKFIHIKILKNFTDATTEKLITIYGLIFELNNVIPRIILNEYKTYYMIGVGRLLNKNEQLYFRVVDALGRRLVPKPVGVGIGYYHFDNDNFFGWDDTPGAKGWSDDPDGGGAWSEEITFT